MNNTEKNKLYNKLSRKLDIKQTIERLAFELKVEIEIYNNSNPDCEILFEDVRNGLNFSPDEKKIIIKSSIEKAKTFSLY